MVTVTREQTLNAGAEGPKRAGTRYPGGTKDTSLVNSSGSSSGKRKMNLQTSEGERAKGLSSMETLWFLSFSLSFFFGDLFIYLRWRQRVEGERNFSRCGASSHDPELTI